MQRYKIGLAWDNKIDQHTFEENLDLNAGIVDRRGRSKSPHALRMGSRVLGVKDFEVKVGGEVAGPRIESV